MLGCALMAGVAALLLIRQPWAAIDAERAASSAGLFQSTAAAGAIADDDAREFAFMSNRDGTWAVYVMRLGDRSLRRLTDGAADDGFASFSAEGGALTFLSNAERAVGEADSLTAYMIDADGSGRRRVANDLPTILSVITNGRLNWDFSVHPAGLTAFVSLRDLNLEIYARLDDGAAADERNLSRSGAIDWFPAISPDGRRIAFASDRDGDQNIYVVNRDGAELRRLTDHPADDLYPVWAADSRQLVFYSERETTLAGGALALYLLDVDAAAPQAHPLQGPVLDLEDATPLAVGIRHAREGAGHLFMANFAGAWDIYFAATADAEPINLTRAERGTAGLADHLFPVWR